MVAPPRETLQRSMRGLFPTAPANCSPTPPGGRIPHAYTTILLRVTGIAELRDERTAPENPHLSPTAGIASCIHVCIVGRNIGYANRKKCAALSPKYARAAAFKPPKR